MLTIPKPYLLFIGDTQIYSDAKTALGLRDWAGSNCIGQYRLPGCRVNLGLPDMSPKEAVAAGAATLVIGVAPVGGRLPPHWVAALEKALAAGLDLAAGLHDRLNEIEALAQSARLKGRSLYDVRVPPEKLPVGTGIKRQGQRLLTVGTDCALGKKYTALAIAREMQKQGVSADFRATGQTGIFISGSGVPLDSVVADFICGAAESISPPNEASHWDIVEGQGSLFHPGYAGVTLGLVHGTQPDAMVLCHAPDRTHIEDCPHIAIPPLDEVMRAYLQAARLTAPDTRFVGLSFNTMGLSDEQANAVMAEATQRHGLPCVDPMRGGVTPLVDALLARAIVPDAEQNAQRKWT